MTVISQAKSDADFREVRRFWYHVYCVVRKVLRDKANHETQELNDPLMQHGKLFMARDDTGAVIGTVMATYARDCELSGYAEFYELSRLTAAPNSVSIVTKLMVAVNVRGSGLALSLLRRVTTAGLRDGITHAVYDANSPTDALFKKVGGVDWLGVKCHPDFGEVRVMMTRLKDDAHILSKPGHPLAECFFDAQMNEDVAPMSIFQIVKATFEIERIRFLRSDVIERLIHGKINAQHYAQLMRQIFHQARENPQLQALATVRFRGARRAAISGFYRHAVSEIGHDELALADYAVCGGDPVPVRHENPHPATSAVTGFAFHQIYNLNPVGYLGYLFFLEFLPTSVGSDLMKKLRTVGVPENAFTFLQDHVTVDVGHNKAMERYCETLILNSSDLKSVIYALQVTSYLYTRMIEAAVSMAEVPFDFGSNSEEVNAFIKYEFSDDDFKQNAFR